MTGIFAMSHATKKRLHINPGLRDTYLGVEIRVAEKMKEWRKERMREETEKKRTEAEQARQKKIERQVERERLELKLKRMGL